MDEIQKDPALKLRLYVTGMHLSSRFGMTVRDVKSAGFKKFQKIEITPASDTPEGIAGSMGRGVLGFAESFRMFRPDILLVLGDRFETLAAVTAAMPFKIPVAHIHGGETTQGAFDELIRHAITKMSHLHFASTQTHAGRIRSMGETAWRVFVSGAPGIDALHRVRIMDRKTFCRKFGMDWRQAFLLVTYHPVTLEYENTETQVRQLILALEKAGNQLVLTYPNADTSGRTIIARLKAFERAYRATARVRLFQSLGPQGYTSAMAHAAAMVGNSSSGIIEAASFKLPVVNVGTRQKGRLRPSNVIDVGYASKNILTGIRKALSHEFRKSLNGLQNPYGNGMACQKIVKILRRIPIDRRLIVKV